MKKSVFNTENISPACEYCQFGRLSPDGETVLCTKKGVVDKAFSCRRYKYDVMKRTPRRAPKSTGFDKADFEL